MQLFDEDWLQAALVALSDLPAIEGASLEIDYLVSGGPAKKATIGVAIENGRVAGIRASRSADPDLVITLGYDTALKILRREMSSDVAFMNGALKVEGAYERWMLELRPARVAAVDALAAVMAETTG